MYRGNFETYRKGATRSGRPSSTFDALVADDHGDVADRNAGACGDVLAGHDLDGGPSGCMGHGADLGNPDGPARDFGADLDFEALAGGQARYAANGTAAADWLCRDGPSGLRGHHFSWATRNRGQAYC